MHLKRCTWKSHVLIVLFKTIYMRVFFNKISFSDEIDNLPEQLGLLVCSLVAAWQCRDIDSINDIKPKIVAELTNIQRRLLNDLIRDRLM